jgi:hypothetical protein
MANWMQNIFVLSIVMACIVYAGWGFVRTLFGKRSRMGSCCAKGCAEVAKSAKPQAAQRVVFLPVEMLGRRK